MCGLVGFIGQSSDQKISEKLTTALFRHTEVRGTDASGFYCVGDFADKNILYHKKPVKSSIYVEQQEYKNLWKNQLTAGMFHCRAASVGVGVPLFNENNHPFVSYDNKKALMHNGLICKNDYDNLKEFYDVETACDSEILLRILEQEEDIFDKLKIFYENTENSAYAAAFLDVDNTYRNLHLFRNEQRPLYLLDVTHEINQVFFFSTLDILFAALQEINFSVANLRIHEIQPYHLFIVGCNDKNEIVLNQYKIELNLDGQKQILKKYKIQKKSSDWQNKITTHDVFSNEVILAAAQKLQINVDNLMQMLTNLAYEKTNKDKINTLYSYIRDTNIKLEKIKKNLFS